MTETLELQGSLTTFLAIPTVALTCSKCLSPTNDILLLLMVKSLDVAACVSSHLGTVLTFYHYFLQPFRIKASSAIDFTAPRVLLMSNVCTTQHPLMKA
ncbi:hypothetical protein CDAR_224221 [Caerostris darwini]|uniref:Uncharacterized protein n=1 Tax=Caerostris darwini TaxID=1538125 RepID=A0AAV4WMT3_9ARAC|nr:hypothetical protein CDAR_224221 [Caerostris darwini]